MGLLSTVLNRLRPRAGTPNPIDDYWYTDIGACRSGAGILVTPDIALKSSALYACVKVLAETIATMPLRMFEELPDGSRVPAPDHPIDDLIRYQPNDRQTAVEFWEMMMLHASLRGVGYAEIIPGRRGAVDQLKPIHTDRMRIEVLKDDSLRFIFSDPRTGLQRTLLQDEVFRIPGMSSDGVRPLRVVDLAAEHIGIGMAADQYAARIFSQNLNFGGFLIHPGKLSEEAQKNIIQRLTERFAGIGGFHRPVVLQEGMKFEKASMTAREAQLENARKWQIGEVARFYRIPLHMLGIDDQTNRSTVEEQGRNFVEYTIRPWVRRIEQAIRRDLIVNPRRFQAKFNMDALLRGNAEARANYYSAALGAGGHEPWMSVEEVRINEGMNARPMVGELRAPTNMQDGGGASVEQLPEPPRALVDNTPDARAERLVRREVAAVRKASMRFAGSPDDLSEWVKAFYGGHVSTVMTLLGWPKEAARVYCAHQRDELLESDDIEATLYAWEDNIPGEIVKAFEIAERGEGLEIANG